MSKKFGYDKFCARFIWRWNKNFWWQNFSFKKCVCLKRFELKKNLVKRIFGSNFFLVNQFFWSIKFLCRKSFWVKKCFGHKYVLVKYMFWSNICFGQKNVLVKKKFLGKNKPSFCSGSCDDFYANKQLWVIFENCHALYVHLYQYLVVRFSVQYSYMCCCIVTINE